MRQPLSITQEPPSCFWASPSLWVVSVVIYSSLPFILLLHLSVIHAYPQVHAPFIHSFWRSVSCCGPHRSVQGSHPHQRGSGCQLCVFNTEVTAFLGAASPPIPLWLAHMAQNLFCDPRVDVLGRYGAFLSHDFGLPKTGSFSTIHFGSLDSLHSSPGISSSLVWALGLKWNGSKPLRPPGLTILNYLFLKSFSS